MSAAAMVAYLAVALAAGTWLGIRWAEAGRRIDDILETVLNTPLPPSPSACAACDPGAADAGARAGTPPAGAGPTLQHPTAVKPASAAVVGHHK